MFHDAVQSFPSRLRHEVPAWVPEGSCFHIQIRCRADTPASLTDPRLAPTLLDSVRAYTERDRWWPYLFLLMPDHCHALLCFPAGLAMSRVIGDWKRLHTRAHGLRWQDNYFDHRLRRDESLEKAAAYIRNNPVVKGLCARPEDWPWVIAAAP